MDWVNSKSIITKAELIAVLDALAMKQMEAISDGKLIGEYTVLDHNHLIWNKKPDGAKEPSVSVAVRERRTDVFLNYINGSPLTVNVITVKVKDGKMYVDDYWGWGD